MKVILITLIGLSTALSHVAAAVGPAHPAPSPLTPQQAQDLVMKLATPYVDLPALRIKAAADMGIAEASVLLEQHLTDPDNGDADAEEGDEEAIAGEVGKKTGYSIRDVKNFQAASASATANEVPLLTMQDGINCSDVCINNKGELPVEFAGPDADAEADEEAVTPGAAKANPGGDADGEDEEEDDAEDDDLENDSQGDEEAQTGADEEDEEDGDNIVERLWKKAKRAVAPVIGNKAAPATADPKKVTPASPAETNDDDDETEDANANANANANAGPGTPTGEKKVLSDSELEAKITSCVKTCMLNRAKEVTPEDLDERRVQLEALLRKQEL
ncbi:hypothetical protein EC991_004100 [Linnemannia zychae]|nr:hypothetical protein EC991_004100 [Linnemannia zychae]